MNQTDTPFNPQLARRLDTAAEWIRGSRVLLVLSGAGMGVDSGLPDFRGQQGFWQAYPHYERLGISFVQAANPVHFHRDPEFGWGFYGHRHALYHSVQPHRGFQLLLEWAARLGLSTFAITSNVDGHFQAAGFDEALVYEVHGSIAHLQCARPCSSEIWTLDDAVEVDEATMRALRVPACPACGGVARPNILMFGDTSFIDRRCAQQAERFEDFLGQHRGQAACVIEIGAGTAVPTIRYLSEHLRQSCDARVIRVNLRDPQIDPPGLSLPMGGLAALDAIDARLR